jgi:NADH:ubiquinone oxidoreductase subunit F (NADH-binding)/(2Fe-2S) ferredoxin
MPPASLSETGQAEQEKLGQWDCRVFCCASTGCLSSGAQPVLDALNQAIASREIGDRVDVVPTGCMGLCSMGPLVRVEVRDRAPVLYKTVDPLVARLIVAEHIVPALAAVQAGEDFPPPLFLNDYMVALDLPFFALQTKVALSDTGRINPERIEDYLAVGGYQALEKVLREMSPEEVIDEMTRSGLRGRGGAGFGTGLKWKLGREVEADEKFVICNGDEGDPGAYMDRSVLEGDPHAVLEGMLIAAYAVGANYGWFYIRAEYPLAVDRVEKAIRQARKYKLLGKNILGSNFDFTCEIRLGAGAFVCGEETALIHSIEGSRGTPRPRPPYPTVRGLWDKPSCVNNVETLANVRHIILRGADWFSSMGTETSKGTKVFALTGKLEHTGLIEVPMGISLRKIVEEIGGGSPTGKPLKAVQTGGPSGGVIPTQFLDTPVCYEELRKLGSMMGSGGMIALDEDDSMVEIANFYLGFTVDESCGKCAPCRVGGTQMVHLLRKVLDGQATRTDLDTIRRLAKAMETASLCGLGQTAANPVTSTLKYFEPEYLDKIDTTDDSETHEWAPLRANR